MDLKSDRQRNIQTELDFSSMRAGEACGTGREETESQWTAHDVESPAQTNRLMEEVCERENLKEALQQVKANNKSIEDLSRMFNPIIRGWLQYYGRFYRSALYPPMRQLDRSLARWADRKYKKLRRHLRRATHWVARISRRDPKLWAHWQMGVRRGSVAGAV